MPQSVLIVEDEPGLVLTLSDLLEREGYAVETAGDGASGLKRALAGRFDAILLDVMLPQKTGLEVCRELRQRGVSTPILMLTARNQTSDKVLGLKLGADDYLAKPFDIFELLARLEALLRRAGGSSPEANTYSFGVVRVDVRRTEVWRGQEQVALSAKEFQLLCYFLEHQGSTLSRSQLLQEVWGYAAESSTRTVDVHVANLRQKLEEDPKQPRFIQTVIGTGYKFVG